MEFIVHHADQAAYLAFLVALFAVIAVEHFRSDREAEKDQAEYEKIRDRWFVKRTVNDVGSVTMMVAAHNNQNKEISNEE